MQSTETTLTSFSSSFSRLHKHPISPNSSYSPQVVTFDFLRQMLVDLIEATRKLDSEEKPEGGSAETLGNGQANQPKTRGSRLEYKTNDEMYGSCVVRVSVSLILQLRSHEPPAYKYKIFESSNSPDLLKAAQAFQTVPVALGYSQPASIEQAVREKVNSPTRASKLEFKTVNEVYVP